MPNTNSLVLDGTEYMEVERAGFRQRVPVASVVTYQTAAQIAATAATAASITALAPRQAAYQAVAYAASITIDPTLGAVVQVGALTGGITIAAPTSPANGDVLQINFVQDGTGGRAVTFNAIFDADSVANQPISTTASKRSQVAFVYAGSVWQ